MTKDGKPSRINDIRLFHSREKPLPRGAAASLQGHEDAAAFARRMAWFLNGEDFSCGAYPALYILFTPTLGPGEIQVTDFGGDWWQRYTFVGVANDFPHVPESSEIVRSGIVSALKAIRPDLSSVVDYAENMVRTHGDDLRFLMQVRKTKHHVVELYFNVPVVPETACLFTSFTKMPKGAFLEGPPFPIQGSPFEYNGPIRMTEIAKSFHEFAPKPRPVMSKLVKNRG